LHGLRRLYLRLPVRLFGPNELPIIQPLEWENVK
jgi:hypothetical protein